MTVRVTANTVHADARLLRDRGRSVVRTKQT